MCRQHCTLNLADFVPYADLQKQRTSIAYDRWSYVWDLARYTNYSIYQSALDSLDEQHRRIVDVGCGTGLMSAKLAATGRQVLGVDLSSSMISRARVRGSARLDFLQAEAENLPLEDASMRRPVGVKLFLGGFCFSLILLAESPLSPLSPPFHPHSLMSDFCSLGASWVFSFQPVLPPDFRPLFHS
ncbi:MAG TPA: class I SAM-dependent methyltransferase [Terriglobales bacterium]|nr:class I SAM-dependent methyltransferase [Terriglobales bacterium]